MSVFNKIPLPFFWQPTGFISSLADATAADGVTSRLNVTKTVGDPGQPVQLTVVEMARAKVIGDLRFVATADNRVIAGLQSLQGHPDPKDHYLVRRLRFRMPKYRRGTAILLGKHCNSDNYFHWMFEIFPAWKMIEHSGWHKNYDYVLLPPLSFRYQEDTLDQLKIPQEKRLRCSKRMVHQFERLVIPDMPFDLDELSPWVCDWLRSLFPARTSGPEKIYLHRGGGRRRLVNEAELEATLTARGFIVANPGQMSVAEQAALLSTARCVVAPHGASLGNLVFSPRGARFIDLFHPAHMNGALPRLAKICGHTYISLAGEVLNQADAKHEQMEYKIDIPTVLRLISETN